MLCYSLFVLLILSAASPTNGAEGLFEELSFDFGSVPMGQMLMHPFRIVNNTKTPVRIANVRCSGATTAQALQYTLAPGQETAIIVQMDSGRFVGARLQVIYVTFDSTRLEEVRLHVRANSRNELAFAPDCLEFKKIKPGTAPTAKMTVFLLRNPQIRVTEAKCASNLIQPKLQELRREGGEVLYQVSATLQGDIPEGKWCTDVWLTTNDAAMPKVRVPVTVEVEPPSVAVKISGPGEAKVDQLITFKVEVQNKGMKATDKEFSLLVQTGPAGTPLSPPDMQLESRPGMDVLLGLPVKYDRPNTYKGLYRDTLEVWVWQQSQHLPVGSIKPGETSKLTFTLTPKQARNLQLAVGVWGHGSSKDGALNPVSNVVTTGVQVKYDPNTPLDVLLPQPPQSGKGLKGLPQTLAEIPEVCFQEPLTKKMETQAAQIHTARVIDRIHFLNGKKTDGFMVAMLSKRPDLAGLPFVLGDDCRMKEEASRHFVAALDGIRQAQRPAESLQKPTPPKEQADMPTSSLPDSQVMKAYRDLSQKAGFHATSRVASLMQVLGPESAVDRHGLAKYLAGESHVAATRALAKLAIFSEEPQVRAQAINALKKRNAKDYSDILLAGLDYPWPAVAQRSSAAIAQLGRTDLIPQLIDVLAQPDPRAPQVRQAAGKKVILVRELVRLNHLHNCLLCHAPATADPKRTPQEKEHFDKLTAQVPLPNESLTAYYRPSNPDILVRLDVTYLRQDFSMHLPVRDAAPWPEMQRYDYLVRSREVTDQEADTLQQLLQPKAPEVLSPYQLAAHSALRELTGLDPQPTALAWTTVLRSDPDPAAPARN